MDVTKHIEAETKRPRFRTRHFQMDFLEWICMNVDYNFIEVGSYGSIGDIPALVQMMAWRRPGAKPLSEPVMVSLPTNKCIYLAAMS